MQTKKLEKPLMRLDLKPIIKEEKLKRVIEILTYIARIKNVKFKEGDIEMDYGYVKNYSMPILQYKYQGEVWLLEFRPFFNTEGYSFESPFIK